MPTGLAIVTGAGMADMRLGNRQGRKEGSKEGRGEAARVLVATKNFSLALSPFLPPSLPLLVRDLARFKIDFAPVFPLIPEGIRACSLL